MVTAGRCLKDLDTLELSDDVKKLFLCDNAKRVFGLQ
jgi:predicted TIM-barrel fold metal-dependent hydrolase